MRMLPLFLAAALALPAGGALAEPKLRASASVSSDVVRLSDLVEGLAEKGETALFRAPAPGASGTIQAARIIAAARDYGISGIETAGLTAITISRPGAAITREAITAALMKALGERREGEALDIALDESVGTRMVDAARAAGLTAVDVKREQGGRFEAKLVTAADARGESESFLVTGQIVAEREVAVPVEGLTRGEPITERDLMLVKRPIAQIPTGTLGGMSDLVGLIPRRPIRAGEPIRESDVVRPTLVERGQVVTVLFQNRGLMLTMRGRALASGIEGATVKVQNTQSKRTIEGTVIGPGQVLVTPTSAEIIVSGAARLPAASESRLAQSQPAPAR